MADNVSMSSLEAVDECFDMLIKSRFIEISRSTDTKHVPLGSLIKPYVAQRCEDCDYPVLSITRHQGLILQSDRFKKEIASRDKSQYKVIPRNVLVVAFPIDEGLLCAQQIVDNGLVSPAYKTYKIDEKIVFPRILELILRSDKSISYYLSKMRGTTLRRRTLPEEEFQSMLIDLPSMSMQKHFIKMLEQIDVVKIICKQIFQLFDDLVKSRFIEMFGHNQYEEKPLNGLFKTSSGGTPLKGKREYYDGGNIPWLTSGEVNNEHITEAKSMITVLALQETSAKIPPLHSVLVSMYGSIGYAGILEFEAAINQAICAIHPSPDYTPEWVCHFIRYKKDELVNQGVGAALTNISQEKIRKLMVPLVPLSQQEAFTAFVHQVDKSKFSWLRSFGSRTVDFLVFLSTTILSFRPLVYLWDSYGELRLLQGIPSILQVR